MFQRSVEQLTETLLQRGVTHLVGIAWVENAASVQAMRNTGFEILGEGWWGDEADGGMCTIGVIGLGANPD